MPNTYTQIHLQFIFAVKYRRALISKNWNVRLHQYMTGIFQNNKHKMLQINSMPDHIHILIGYRPHQPIPGMIQNVKSETTKWIQRNRFCNSIFEWQNGYGAFAYSKSHLPRIIRYIANQDKYHKKITFLEEYRKLLDAFEVEYNDRYLFTDPQ